MGCWQISCRFAVDSMFSSIPARCYLGGTVSVFQYHGSLALRIEVSGDRLGSTAMKYDMPRCYNSVQQRSHDVLSYRSLHEWPA